MQKKNIVRVRVRFAPSPTGKLHIGGIRTALFNWLFAKNKRGEFILRIEDTDVHRSTKVHVEGILDTLKWLKLNWDKGPYYQMQRTKLYSKYINKLIKKHYAYKCYCTVEDIYRSKCIAKKSKIPFKHVCKCKTLTLDQIKHKKNKPVVRFIVPKTGKTVFHDLIRGIVVFDNSLFSDFVIMKSDNIPTYNLACVIDDYSMSITHVLRGDDHISNTPRQILIYNALGWSLPKFAHISMILGCDGKRLSKRYDSISVLKYRKDGYLQEAILNYLALLGWSTTDSQQIFTKEDLQNKFSLEQCSSNPAIFDPDKLLWINKEKIRSKSVEEIYNLFIEWVNYVNLNDFISDWNSIILKKVIALEHNKLRTLNDIITLGTIFFNYNLVYNKDTKQVLFDINTKLVLTECRKQFSSNINFSSRYLELYTRNLASEFKLTTSQVFHTIRIAVSGTIKGPSLFSMMEILGKNEVTRRIDLTLEKINKSHKRS
jgi:glutamyl-tRNA synthetase